MDVEPDRQPERPFSVFLRWRDEQRLGELLGCGGKRAAIRFRRAWGSARYHGDAWWRLPSIGIDVAVNGRSVVGVRRVAPATDEADRRALAKAGFVRRDQHGRERWIAPNPLPGDRPEGLAFATAWRRFKAIEQTQREDEIDLKIASDRLAEVEADLEAAL